MCDTPYDSTYDHTPKQSHRMPIFHIYNFAWQTRNALKATIEGGSTHKPDLPSLPAETMTTRPLFTRVSSTTFNTASGPATGHVGPDPKDLIDTWVRIQAVHHVTACWIAGNLSFDRKSHCCCGWWANIVFLSYIQFIYTAYERICRNGADDTIWWQL